MKKNIATLKKIAQQLELSISTISRALNNHPDISNVTKEKVNLLANKLNYTPNLFAKNFRTQKSNMIGVIVPKISHYLTATIIEGIIDESDLKGYKVIVFESKNDIKKQSDMLKTMLNFGVDGILLSLSKKTDEVESIFKIMNNIPLVLFDKVSNKIPCTQIIINEREAAFKIVEHLINSGKTKIAIIMETENSFNSQMRYEGYLQALKKYNLPIKENLIISVDNISLAQGINITRQLLLLKEKPDGIFAITDECAIGVIKALNSAKINIPKEIAVVGFSNSFGSEIVEPNLTTIEQPGNKMGQVAAKFLINEIEDSSDFVAKKTIEIQTKLIIRSSSY